MPEIKTPPIVLSDDDIYCPGAPAVVFTEEHSWCDVIRWLLTDNTADEIAHLARECSHD